MKFKIVCVITDCMKQFDWCCQYSDSVYKKCAMVTTHFSALMHKNGWLARLVNVCVNVSMCDNVCKTETQKYKKTENKKSSMYLAMHVCFISVSSDC